MIWSIVTLGGLGVLFGALLALAARFFAVESDPRVEEIAEVLPGANCGACGYAGCQNFAQAVVEGKAAVDSCIPGGSETAEAIGKILGQDVEGREPVVAAVFCIGDREKASSKFIYFGIEDCRIAEEYGGGFKDCPYGCLGLGSCVAACPFDAMRMGPDGLPEVDRDKCTGCGLCKEACPRGIIRMIPREERGHLVLCNSRDRGRAVSRACQVGCIGCRACVRACPEEAITMEENLAVIDLDRCNDCGECVPKCRPGCIIPRKGPATGVEATETKTISA
ncbi:MAG: Fe-S cluster domain-containing protein [Firmicutes bacterium]|nr:Fe-S cluster domain-containing protein [Bacillota bacterium]